MAARPICCALLLALLLAVPCRAGAPEPPKPDAVAKELFGAQTAPADLQARAIGFYAKGCLAGATALPINGETWQVMRLSRNRNWGHPKLIGYLEKLAAEAPKVGWRGLLVGDLAQPRGGPMLTGHASHQIGLDADIWLTPMPENRLSTEERESLQATNVVNGEWTDVDPQVWTPQHGAIIKAAAQDPDVERIFVNAAIKKALCREAGSVDRGWLHKVRPYYGHYYHFHVRMRCPNDSADCTGQPAVPEGEGCGSDLAWWFSEAVRKPKKPASLPQRQMKLSALPPACRQVLMAP
jgi:penicillin-insensitive murein endopeptidase